MAKMRGYASLTLCMDEEVLTYTRCKDWDEANEQFDCVALVRELVRSFEHQGRVYYMLIPNKTDEERYALAEKHRKRPAPNWLESKPVGRRSDIPYGTVCDRCCAPARVRAQFSAGPLYACQHHANEFGWWLESIEKEA